MKNRTLTIKGKGLKQLLRSFKKLKKIENFNSPPRLKPVFKVPRPLKCSNNLGLDFIVQNTGIRMGITS